MHLSDQKHLNIIKYLKWEENEDDIDSGEESMEEGKVNLKEKKSEIKIFMEYVPGGSIKDLMKLFKTFSE